MRAHRKALYESGKAPTASGGTVDVYPSGLTEGAGECLRDLAVRELSGGGGREGGPARTIEVGCAMGLSALFIIEAMLSVEGEERGWRHVAVDPFQLDQWGDSGVLSAERAGVADRLAVIREDSLLALPGLAGAVESGREAPFDFAFIDGGHHFENAFIDTYYMCRMVRPGGVIVVDDVWMPGIALAVSYFERNLGVRREGVETPAAKRFAVLRTPERAVRRAWDHFVPF
ncbi:MAG: class I SAM-dependent methyltransferase [Phycisphaeraceae bacterium]|nr:class I SAM-dependent methyltransferase [Phycisphaeraceae bacterium]